MEKTAGVAPVVVPQTRRAKSSEPGPGLAVPSTCPNGLRTVVPCGSEPYARRKPSRVHATSVKARASFMSMRTVWATVAGSSLHTCSNRSPSVRPGWNRSKSKRGRGFNQSGAERTRSTKRFPNPNVTVKRAGRSVSSGSVSPSGGFPCVRAAASSDSKVSRRRTPSRSTFSRSVSAINMPCACGGVSTPA